MAGPPPPSFDKGRLALVWLGISLVVLLAWLLLRTPEEPEPVPVVAVAPATPEQPIAYYLARADAARGERYFARCAACHSGSEGGPHGLGPNLWGVMGAPLAARPDYAYSEALRGQDGRWDWETMARFLKNPRAFAPGTRMAFAGIADPQDRADLLLWLNRQGGSLAAPAAVR